MALPAFAQAAPDGKAVAKPAAPATGKTATESKPEPQAKAVAKVDAKAGGMEKSTEALTAQDGSDIEPPLEEMPHFRCGRI